MRLLDKTRMKFDLSGVGMLPDTYATFRRLIDRPHGILLVTGPTGSGKSTTLYSALNEIKEETTKIITVEDPVEYRLPGISQIQVNHDIDLTFATVLRAMLRQDPDIIMVGEIRDSETLEIAIRAAMTGHLVFATLHTNDVLGTVARLLDMGAEGYLVASVLRAILAQRLVRKICKHCINNAKLTPEQEAWLQSVTQDDWQSIQFKKGTGCPQCHHTGYHGRIGVYEFLIMNKALIDALRMNQISQFQELMPRSESFQSLLNGALSFAFSGITTVDEVITMIGEI